MSNASVSGSIIDITNTMDIRGTNRSLILTSHSRTTQSRKNTTSRKNTRKGSRVRIGLNARVKSQR